MSEITTDRGMDFETAIFNIIFKNVDGYQKQQDCLRGIMDCVCRWGEAGQLPRLTPDDNIVIRKHGTREFYDGVVELPKDPDGLNPFVEMAKEMYSGWQVDPIQPLKELRWRSIMKPDVIPLIWYGAGSLCFLAGTIVSILRAL